MARALFATVVVGILGLTTACSQGGALWKDGDEPAKPKGPQVTASISEPKSDAKDVPASVEIKYATELATSATVELKTGGADNVAGKPIAGELRPGTTTWVPKASLDYGMTYSATVTATAADGTTATTTNTFTTMAKPANTIRVSTNIGDNAVVGVGMPMVLRFSRGVPKDFRDDVERRLWVATTPVQEGSWHWFSDSELHYRPKQFWRAGTKLDFRIAAGGLPLGSGWYGRSDVTVAAKVRPDALVMTVDNATKKMTVVYKGQVVNTLPVSLGKTATPSSSGTMVVMERLRNTIFDTMNDPNPVNRYKIPIEYAQRITWGGEFIHAAPWSEGVQGRQNVSHGCVNVSQNNAKWLFDRTMVGDPVTVKGTERVLQKGNGWTDWSMTWNDYVKGSALPPTAAAPTPTGAPTPTS